LAGSSDAIQAALAASSPQPEALPRDPVLQFRSRRRKRRPPRGSPRDRA
jgi:hypothetical protein